MDTATGIQGKAQEAYACFESALRDESDQDSRYDRVKDGSPEWVKELVYHAHGDDFLPDDWRYSTIRSALEFIAGTDDPEDGQSEFADQNVDVYNGARLAWLSSNLRRASYCDEATDEFGGDYDTFERIGLGQYAEGSEVYALVLEFLGDVADEDEDEDE